MTHKPVDATLWTPRSVPETQALYATWAERYDADMARMDYATPGRIAAALSATGLDKSLPVLDFGCGTGLSGEALASEGFTTIDGCDITAEMLTHAEAKGIYRTMIHGEHGAVPSGDYAAIIATGVVSLGAAPPEMLAILAGALPSGGYLAFSYSDPTLTDADYMSALASVTGTGPMQQVSRAHGPHLNDLVTGSDVIVLRRT